MKWLLEQLKTRGFITSNLPDELVQAALEREEEQIIDAWFDAAEMDGIGSGENYYVKNFGYLRD